MNSETLHKITETEFWEALEVLPPLQWHTVERLERFLMSEFYSGVMTTQYAQYNNNYACKLVDAYNKDSWITKEDMKQLR
jgi:hypothetical protein